ncbi:MAG: hypothetical protein EXX96DRAFT_555805 [Benjaminiella poitrasii]|nr:MAG: hypothetical protein EXX96DRAFT_555805 [Benjaminiella poitrasii]
MKWTSTLPFILFTASTAVLASSSETTVNATSVIESLLNYNTTLLSIVQTFDGIIFGDFTAEPKTQQFNGSLAVQGNFTATDYIVDSKQMTADCSRFDFVVEGGLETTNTTVNGNYYISSGNTTGIVSSCTNTNFTIDFDDLFTTAMNISQMFANMKPNMVLRNGGYLSDGEYLGSSEQQYYIYTFNECDQSNSCILPDYLYSSGRDIFYGSNWTGPYNSGYPTNKPIVFNIPILSNTVFNMSTPNPAAGLEGIDVLYNVYPVTESGDYDSTGHVVWLRNTTHNLTGFMLAPLAYIVENNLAGFQNSLVASRYLSVTDLNAMFDNNTFTGNLTSSSTDTSNTTTINIHY